MVRFVRFLLLFVLAFAWACAPGEFQAHSPTGGQLGENAGPPATPANEPAPSPENGRYAQPPPDAAPSAPSAQFDRPAAKHARSTQPMFEQAPSGAGDASGASSRSDAEPATPPPPAPPPMANKAKKGSAAMGADDGYDTPRSRDIVERRPEPQERQGLATTWGETRYSQVNEMPFTRQSSYPECQGSIYYNDRIGVQAAARNQFWNGGAANISVGCGVKMQLRDEYGSVLQGARANGRIYALGNSEQRYTITIINDSNWRYEAVVSVDGLDVLDGKAASTGKRGYLVPAHGEVTIDGFRRSNQEVAAFRFGSVADSYAAKTGDARNVGVIGLAAFAEQHYVPPPVSWYDLQRRHVANPFPAGYAVPPQEEAFTVR